MWLYPRMVVWVILTVLAGVLARLPFAQVPIIPHYLDFHPGVVLVPLAGVFFGPAGAWGSLVASIIGDRLMGPWGAITLFRALGFFAFALSAQKMAMNGAEAQGQALVRMIDETIAIADPERAARVDVTA